mmetsp:Transcript_52881/g.132993  ORF Transcript_52881/g.132993 Transcript_52881/m.132993 type:complete len:242 (+) Transcript_52881:2060-2785(+)
MHATYPPLSSFRCCCGASTPPRSVTRHKSGGATPPRRATVGRWSRARRGTAAALPSPWSRPPRSRRSRCRREPATRPRPRSLPTKHRWPAARSENAIAATPPRVQAAQLRLSPRPQSEPGRLPRPKLSPPRPSSSPTPSQQQPVWRARRSPAGSSRKSTASRIALPALPASEEPAIQLLRSTSPGCTRVRQSRPRTRTRTASNHRWPPLRRAPRAAAAIASCAGEDASPSVSRAACVSTRL